MQINSAERSVLPLTDEDWFDCKQLVVRLMDTDELAANLKLKYLQGVACFHLRDLSNGFQVFRDLERESQYYGRRIMKHHLWGHPSGQPLSFNGTVAWVNEKGRGEIQVNEIQRRIPFLVHDTGRSEVNEGDSFNNFRIGFNMRGPLADFRE